MFGTWNESFPSLRNSHSVNEFKVKQIERTLEKSLDDEERMIIEKKYLTGSQTKDIHIYGTWHEEGHLL